MSVPTRSLGGVTAEQWALILALPLGQVSNIALFTVLAEVRTDFDLSYPELGTIISVFAVSRLAMGFPAGPMTRWLNPRAVLLGSLVACLLSSVVGAISASAWQLGLARVLHGAASALLQAVVLGWLVGGASATMRGRVMALSEAGFGLASFVAPIVVGLLAENVGWRSAFVSGAVTSAVGVLAVLLWTNAASSAAAMGQRASASDDTSAVPLRAAFRAGGTILLATYLLAFLVFFARQAVLSTVLPLLAADRIGLSPLQVGLGQSLMNVLSIPILLLGGWWGDRVGRRYAVVPGIAVLLLTQCAMFLIVDQPSFFVICAFMSLGFLVNSFPTSLVGDALPGRARAQGIVVYRMVADVALLLAPVIVGILLEAVGFDVTRLAALLPTLAVLLGIALLMPEGRRPLRANPFAARASRNLLN
jgi:MFS family permease